MKEKYEVPEIEPLYIKRNDIVTDSLSYEPFSVNNDKQMF